MNMDLFKKTLTVTNCTGEEGWKLHRGGEFILHGDDEFQPPWGNIKSITRGVYQESLVGKIKRNSYEKPGKS